MTNRVVAQKIYRRFFSTVYQRPSTRRKSSDIAAVLSEKVCELLNIEHVITTDDIFLRMKINTNIRTFSQTKLGLQYSVCTKRASLSSNASMYKKNYVTSLFVLQQTVL